MPETKASSLRPQATSRAEVASNPGQQTCSTTSCRRAAWLPFFRSATRPTSTACSASSSRFIARAGVAPSFSPSRTRSRAITSTPTRSLPGTSTSSMDRARRAESPGPRGGGYYSFDIAGWHVIALNTSDDCRWVSCDAGSPQHQWLVADTGRTPSDLYARVLAPTSVRGGQRRR